MGHVARQAIKDMRELPYDLFDTYLSRAVKKQSEVELMEWGRTWTEIGVNVVVNHLLRGRRADEEEGEERRKSWSLEGRDGRCGWIGRRRSTVNPVLKPSFQST